MLQIKQRLIIQLIKNEYNKFVDKNVILNLKPLIVSVQIIEMSQSLRGSVFLVKVMTLVLSMFSFMILAAHQLCIQSRSGCIRVQSFSELITGTILISSTKIRHMEYLITLQR
jgi:hypothetical protein